MSILYADFNGTAQDGLVGFAQASTTSGKVTAFDTTGSGTAKSTGTGTGIALATANAPTSADQFAQITFATNSGVSTGVVLRAVKVNSSTSDPNFTGYLVRHNGTAVAAFAINATGGTTAVGAPASHTRAVGTKLRATIIGTTLRVYVDDMTTPVITATDTTYSQVGTVGIRTATTNGVELNEFYGGDNADIVQVGSIADNSGSSGGGGTPIVVPDVVTNDVSPTGAPPWKGVTQTFSGRLLHPGVETGRFDHSFLGASGTAVLPTWLTSPEGTLTQTDPATSLPRLDLTTAATVGAKATLALAWNINLASYAAIRIDIQAFQFLTAAPAAKFRLGAIGNTGLLQTANDSYVALHSGGEVKQTVTDKYSLLSPSANQRRPVSVLIVPAEQEVFLIEDAGVRMGHQASRWTSGSWTNAAVQLGLQIEATSAVAVSARLSRITVRLYA